ncbi:MAG: DUF1549 domain-containing protein [Verrucomicrobiaceae bacterium]|nr:DUF1549 domain-containing protein [Verrucomicrobiaceae bacterium]
MPKLLPHFPRRPRRDEGWGAVGGTPGWRIFCLFGLGVLAAPLSAQQENQEKHWSLRALTRPAVNEGTDAVDFFIQKKLAAKSLRQNEAADRHTLLRRASLDLTGLPPTREEIAAFLDDTSPDAWETLVDRLLASPHYGERWGRHWLDVARYVQGTVKVPGIDEIDLAEPYRDYVVRSFNEDKPYDRFLTEQLAGDLLRSSDETEAARQARITAPAFLSIGQWFDECTDPNKLRLDIVDEQISTATRAFLAMDFSCARCHDHKFDPVSIRDYYALAGIFRSTEITEYFSEEWKDGRPRAVRALAPEDELKKAAALDEKRNALLEARFARLAAARERVLAEGEGRFGNGTPPHTVLSFEAEDFDGHKDLKTIPLGDGAAVASRRRLDQWVRYRLTIPEPGNYTLLVRYASTEPAPVELRLNEEAAPARILAQTTFGESPEHFRWGPVSLRDLKAGTLFLRLKVDRHEPFPVLDRFLLVKGPLGPVEHEWRATLGRPTVAEVRSYLNAKENAEIQSLEKDIAALERDRPDFPLTLAVHDGEHVDLAIHPGGDPYSSQGEPVPRGNPTLADHLIDEPFPIPAHESGRVQFARWLAHPDHPLTARVIANRIWHWHFGTGLVRTTDDFGKQGSPPSHPELLDWLAVELIESGWSIKHLQRVILLSETYRASSAKTPDNLAGDADGLLLSRFPARRLEVEAIYDSLLTSIGKVPRQPSGTPLDTSLSKDRALYILTSSRAPLGLGVEIRKMFPLFGFDDSGRPMHDRDDSASPAQSLWWLNNPLPRHYADTLATRLIEAHPEATERAEVLHEIVLGRPPSREAGDAMLRYAADLTTESGLSESEAWTRVALGLFSSHSFRSLE